jgi:hypothetical protein
MPGRIYFNFWSLGEGDAFVNHVTQPTKSFDFTLEEVFHGRRRLQEKK